MAAMSRDLEHEEQHVPDPSHDEPGYERPRISSGSPSLKIMLPPRRIHKERMTHKDVREMAENVQGGGYMYFRDGASSFTDAMVADLRSNPNVNLS